MTCSYMRHDSSIVDDMTHSYARPDPFKGVTYFIYVLDITHSYAQLPQLSLDPLRPKRIWACCGGNVYGPVEADPSAWEKSPSA